MRKIILAGAFLGLAVSACTAPGDDGGGGGGGVRTTESLDALLAIGPNLKSCSLAEVSSRLGVTFTETGRTAHSVTSHGKGSGAISGYELRSPIPANQGGGILIANVHRKAVRFDHAFDALGRPEADQIDVQPDNPVVSWAFDLGRNQIWIGYRHDNPDYLEGVSVHCR